MNLFDSFIEGAQGSTVRERGEFYVAVIEYLYYGREPDFKMCKWASQAFTLIHPVLDKQIAKQNAGRAGGKARGKSQAKGQAKTKQTVKQNQTEQYLYLSTSSMGMDSCSGEGEYQPSSSSEVDSLVGSAFVPPTVDELRDYCAANGLTNCDPELFIAYYSSQGWRKPNRLPVTDWRPLAQQWSVRNRNEEAANHVRQRTSIDFSEFSPDKWVRG